MRRFTLGGRHVRIETTSERLLSALWPPLAHLRAEAGDPALRIRAWQGVRHSPPLPSVSGPGGLVRSLSGERTMVVVHETSRLIMALDLDAGEGFLHAEDAAELPWWERAAPLRSLLGWWVHAAGQQLAHAAGVSRRGRAVVLAGRSGSGKSTAALACLREPDFGIVGDDYVLLRSDPLVAESVFGCAKIDPGHQEARLPWLEPLVVNPKAGPEEKRVVAWATALPDRLSSAAPVAALAVARVVRNGRCSVREIPRAKVLLELAPTTVFQLPGAGRSTLSRLSGWVRRLPAYELRIGRDPRGVPEALRDLLDLADGAGR